MVLPDGWRGRACAGSLLVAVSACGRTGLEAHLLPLQLTQLEVWRVADDCRVPRRDGDGRTQMLGDQDGQFRVSVPGSVNGPDNASDTETFFGLNADERRALLDEGYQQELSRAEPCWHMRRNWRLVSADPVPTIELVDAYDVTCPVRDPLRWPGADSCTSTLLLEFRPLRPCAGDRFAVDRSLNVRCASECDATSCTPI